MSSYAIRENHNLQTVLWDGCAALIRLPGALWSVGVAVVAWSVWLAQLFAADASTLGQGMLTASLWCVGVAAVAGALVALLLVPQLIVGGVVISAYAFVTKPK